MRVELADERPNRFRSLVPAIDRVAEVGNAPVEVAVLREDGPRIAVTRHEERREQVELLVEQVITKETYESQPEPRQPRA